MSVQNRVPLFLPENLICDTVNAILHLLRADYTNKIAEGREEENLLYLMLHGQSLGKIDIYKDAIKIFITTAERPKHFDCKLDYDKTSTKSPQIYISQGAENAGNNAINMGEGGQDELIFARNDEPDQYRVQFTRRYATAQYLMIVCENRMEMQIIYNVLKAMIVACMNHLALKGISNLKLNGQELKMRGEIPDTLFQKAIVMNFEYDQVAPSIVLERVYRDIKLYWKFSDAEERRGPIDISVSDDLVDSSSS